MSDDGRCNQCRGPATRLLVRSELGKRQDRILTCGDPACTPAGSWENYARDAAGLARDLQDKEKSR